MIDMELSSEDEEEEDQDDLHTNVNYLLRCMQLSGHYLPEYGSNKQNIQMLQKTYAFLTLSLNFAQFLGVLIKFVLIATEQFHVKTFFSNSIIIYYFIISFTKVRIIINISQII
jgi:hypothetical protein